MHRLGGLLSLWSLSSFLHPALAEGLELALKRAANIPDDQLAKDEDFWRQIQQAYTVSASLINLNNGGVSPQPRVVQEAVERFNRLSNEAPTYYMWRILNRNRESLRRKLAQLAGCSPQEIAINRNASEALETVIFGLRLRAGDEVILSRQDYPSVINAWKQRELRDGIVLKWLNFDFPIEDEEAITKTFVDALSPQTRIVQITHIINWTGQVMPVRRIVDAVKRDGIDVMVDGAHSFAQLDYAIPDLNCDYFGTSLHKWLCAPFGTGMLYVRKEKIAQLYPLLAAPDPESDDIRKFENLGTRSLAIEYAIANAIDFHLLIGTKRKQLRLQYLKRYWAEKAMKIPGVRLHSSLDPAFGCAIALFSIDDCRAFDIMSFLFQKGAIHTVAIDVENIHGIRITPNVYTMTYDLDRLIDMIGKFVEEKEKEKESKSR